MKHPAPDIAHPTPDAPDIGAGEVATIEAVLAQWLATEPPAEVEAWREASERAAGDVQVRSVERVVALVLGRLDDVAQPSVDDVAAAPPPPPPEARSAEAQDVAGAWAREVEQLYEDALFLFGLGDVEGALISVERLLVVAPRVAEFREFIALNEARLLPLYEKLFGGFDEVPERVEDAAAELPPAFLSFERIARVYEAVDGAQSVRDIFGSVPLSRLEVCCCLSQLVRAGVVRVGPVENLEETPG